MPDANDVQRAHEQTRKADKHLSKPNERYCLMTQQPFHADCQFADNLNTRREKPQDSCDQKPVSQ